MVGLACVAVVLAMVALLMVSMKPSYQAREQYALKVVTAMDLCLMEPTCVVTPADWERYQRARSVLGENNE
jgi:hypothetical protein